MGLIFQRRGYSLGAGRIRARSAAAMVRRQQCNEELIKTTADVMVLALLGNGPCGEQETGCPWQSCDS